MPGNESRAKDGGQGAAENFSDICTATCTTEDKPRRVDNQVITFPQKNEEMLRQVHLLAIDVDLIECTPESRLLRTLAYRAWREVFIWTPEAINGRL